MKIVADIEPIISLTVYDINRFGQATKIKTKFKSAHHAALHYAAYSMERFNSKLRNVPMEQWNYSMVATRHDRAYRRSLPIFKRMLKGKL